MAVRTSPLSPLRLFLLYFLFFVDLRPTKRGEIKGGKGAFFLSASDLLKKRGNCINSP